MSYILDALRRSQAERERGQVPGLDARPAAVAALPEVAPGMPWRWVVLTACVVAIVALAWLWESRTAPPAERLAAAPTTPAPTPTPPTAVVVPEPTVAPGPAALPIVVSAPALPPVAPPVPSPAQGVAPTPRVTAAAPAAPAPASAPPAVAATPLAALSPALRRELPPLVLGGSIWSDNALSRFVIVNGQVVREGETAAPGVVVDRIGPKAVWLRWRELRLEVPL